jgi:hypothetical protein
MKRKLAAMGLAVAVLLSGSLQLGIDPASSQTPTPTSAPGPTGSISGRVYVDVDANSSFGGPDVALALPLDLFFIDVSGPPIAAGGPSSDGAYEFQDLPPGNYRLHINVPIIACAQPIGIPPFDWVGEVTRLFLCGNPQFSTPQRDIVLGAGETLANVDFPQLPTSYEISARVWLNAALLTAQNSVIVTAGGNPCWTAQVNTGQTLAGVTVSRYSARLEPLNDLRCQSGNLDITIDGRAVGLTKPWDQFWMESLIPYGTRPLAFQQDVAIPGFLGISGQVAEAGTVTPQNVAQHQGILVPDGTTVSAFVGNTACGEARTKALTTAPSQAHPNGEFGGNLFGLVVTPANVKTACGAPGALVTFCVGDFKARQPAAGPFSYFQSPEAKPVQWAAPALADVTLEPTMEACLATDAPPGPAPERLPTSLPSTGGRRN